MAAGDLIYAPYQYEWDGLLMGSDTPYIISSITGLLGLADMVTADEERQEDHGSWSYVDLLSGQHVVAKVQIDEQPGPGVEQAIEELVRRFQPFRAEDAFQTLPFLTMRPGHDIRFLNARPRRCAFESNYNVAMGFAEGGFELFCPDPRVYSLVSRATTIQMATNGTSASGVVDMHGTFRDGCGYVITLLGPFVNPRITNADDGGKALRLDVTAAAGDSLVIDAYKKTAKLNGVDVPLRTDNQWWSLLPGTNTITYTRSTALASSLLTIAHRDAWASV